MSQPWSRITCASALLLAIAAGCQDNYMMVTAALDTVSESSTIGSSGSTSETGGTTSNEPTSGPTTSGGGGSDSHSGGTDSSGTGSTGTDPTGGTTTSTTTDTTGWDPTATTGAPVTCDAPGECTGEGSGDLGPLVLPFFRGEVCVSDTLRPNDPLAISWNPCVHPCIDPKKLGWRYLVRCEGGVACEIAFMQYYREAMGSNCPSDVFAKFNPDACKYAGPHKGLTEGLKNFGYPDDKLIVPFLTNEDAAAVSMLEPSGQVWARIDGHPQSEDRYFALSVSDQNPAPPSECGPGVPGCTCKKVGF